MDAVLQSTQVSLLCSESLTNTYIWQSNRRLDNRLNVFEGLHRNWYFIAINLITIIGQVLIVSFGGSPLSATRLNSIQWAISLGLGAMSLPIAVLIRLIPNDSIRRIFPKHVGRKRLARVELPEGDDFIQDELLEDMRASFRIRRNSKLSMVRFRKLREIFSAIRE